ncbi:MAG: hypothetical protein AABW57_01625 [Nanoarchaeota archaeon]
MKTRKGLIERLGTREDGGFPLYDLEELEKLIKAGNDKKDWYCSGRKQKQDNINYCVYAFNKNDKCSKDCKFYKKLYF